MLIGCTAIGKSSGVITSGEATTIWHAYEIRPNFHYYYAGPDAHPHYIIGIDDRYKLMSKLWKPVDLTPETNLTFRSQGPFDLTDQHPNFGLAF